MVVNIYSEMVLSCVRMIHVRICCLFVSVPIYLWMSMLAGAALEPWVVKQR